MRQTEQRRKKNEANETDGAARPRQRKAWQLPPKWQQDLNEWLRPFGLAYLQIGMFDEWCAEVGVKGCHHEVAGPTKRSNDVLHACVGVDGVPVFDPHPDDTGLTEVQSSGVFIALEPWRSLTPGRQACLEAADEIERLREECREEWKEAAIGWTVCGSVHEQWAKGKDALYTTRHWDFERHAEEARQRHHLRELR